MVYCIIACVIAVPVSVVAAGRYLETFVYKMPQKPWIYIVAAASVFGISLASVLWQTLRAARTNPAETLKKE
jgi:putative ABC transport system permease protein